LDAIYWLLLGSLCVWRLTRLVSLENGPGDVFVRLRAAVGQGFLGTLLGCFACCSLWVAIPFAVVVGGGWPERALLWPALSGASILFQRLEGVVEAVPHSTRRRCCGGDKSKGAISAARTAPVGPRALPWIFQYVGHGDRTVVAEATGRKYHWSMPGAQVEVDERDGPYLKTLSDLKLLGPRSKDWPRESQLSQTNDGQQ
jgi:hypothetical protein